eukprot:Pgem_evm1s10228
MVSVEPARPVVVDGISNEKDNWITETKHEDYQHFNDVRLAHDEAYLYVSIRKAKGVSWNSTGK